MIISHKHQFIYIKTTKTASTSTEIALSQFCGADDIITPLGKNDEKKRKEMGFRGAQNYYVPWQFYEKLDWIQLLRGQAKKFYNHASARFIRQNIVKDIWDKYFKFTIERNPFDKAISRYYYDLSRFYSDTNEPQPSMADYLNSFPVNELSNWRKYTINDQLVTDFVGRYERLTDDLGKVADIVGLPGKLKLPRAKAGHRPDRKHYSNILSEQARSRVELVCAKEMKTFGYEWQEQA